MNEKTKYFLFLIERYAKKHNRFTGDVLKDWDKHNITNEIYDNYEIYHQESIENAFDDIDSLIKTGQHIY